MIQEGRGWPGALRWLLPAGLLVAEYLIVSFLVDLPTAGPAMQLVRPVRLAVPVVLGAGGAGLLLARRPGAAELLERAIPLDPWRPAIPLLLNLALFAGLAVAARRLLGPGAPPVSSGALAAWLAGAAVVALFGILTAAAPAWLVARLGSGWRLALLALAFGVASWRAAAAAEGLWGLLSDGTLGAVAALLRLSGGDVRVDLAAKAIGLRGFEVEVAPVCSGVDGLGLVLLFEGVWLALARERLRFPRALLLLPIGAAAAFAANALRIGALLAIGAAGWEGLALGGLHSKLGWILFILVALATVAAAEGVRFWRRVLAGGAPGSPVVDPGASLSPAAAAYLAPLLAAMAVALATSIWSDGPLDRWYGLRLVAPLGVLLVLGRDLPRPRPGWSPAAALLGLGVLALWLAWPAGDPRPLADAVGHLPVATRVAWIGIRVAGAVLVIPVVEELAFRGFLLPWLTAPDFEAVDPRRWSWPAVAGSALAFGALHGRFLAGVAAGIAFALARRLRGRLGDAILAHAVCNAGIALAVLAGGRWDLW